MLEGNVPVVLPAEEQVKRADERIRSPPGRPRKKPRFVAVKVTLYRQGLTPAVSRSVAWGWALRIPRSRPGAVHCADLQLPPRVEVEESEEYAGRHFDKGRERARKREGATKTKTGTPSVSTASRISIIGSGLMGPGIAASAALAGNEIVLCGRDSDRVAAGIQTSRGYIRQLAEGGIVGAATATRAENLIRGETDLSAAVAGAFWVIEAISEDIVRKQELFRTLDEIVPHGVILSSNTSGLRITDIAKYAKERGRTATTHFWFPAHLVPLVEVVMGDATSESVATRLRDLLLTWGKAPVIVRRDVPGQLANRILQAIIREASAIVDSGLASAEDVDTAVKMGMGLRFPAWGPLEHVDTVGLELCLSVQESVLPSLYNEAHAAQIFRRLLAAGDGGVKTGKGFHDWAARSHADLVAQRDHFLIQALKILGRHRRNGNSGPA